MRSAVTAGPALCLVRVRVCVFALFLAPACARIDIERCDVAIAVGFCWVCLHYAANMTQHRLADSDTERRIDTSFRIALDYDKLLL